MRGETHNISIITRALCGALLLCGLVLGGNRDADAEDDVPNAVIIYDGSGSMWGRLGARTKHDISRRAMAAILPSYNRQIAMGLIAYGHRRKSDCNDIQILAGPEPQQAADLVASINTIRPRGKTPIASSLESAATLLFENERGHIVLLTDGVENCRKDLCDTVTAIREAAPGLTISAIGLGLRQKDIPRIQCIADQGGGRLVIAKNAEDLTTGLLDIFDDIASGTSPSPSVSETTANLENTPPPEPPSLQLRALQAETGPPITDPVTWRVTSLDTASAPSVYATNATDPNVPVPKGRFRVEARIGNASAVREITVSEDGARSVHMPLNVARLDLKLATPLMRGETLTLLRKDQNGDDGLPPNLITRQNTTTERFYLPPGDYAVRRSGSSVSDNRTVSLSAGDTTTLAFDTLLGTLKPSLPASISTTLARHMIFIVEQATGNDTATTPQWKEVARSAAPSPLFALPAERYRLRVRAGQIETHTEVDVKAGEMTSARLDLNAGTLALATVNQAQIKLPAPLRFVITPRANAAGPTIETSRRNATLVLKEGTYSVSAEAGRTNLRATTEVIVQTGKPQRAEFTFNPARLKLSVAKRLGAPVARDLSWTVASVATDGSAKTVWSGSRRFPDLTLAPGSYQITARVKDRAVSQPIVLTGGQTRSIEIAHP